VLLVLAGVIAAGGVVGESTPAVIGAMIVAPLATPIYGVALATVTGSRRDLLASLRLLVAGVLVFTAAGYARVAAARGRQPRRRAKVLITVFVALLLIPLAGASFRTLEYELWMRTTDDVAHTWVMGTDWKVESVKQAGSDIVILVVGQGDTPPIDALREAVRRDVLRSVDVLVIEESGRTTAL